MEPFSLPCNLLTSYAGFEFGSANSPIYNGQYFADNQDVVIVTVKSVST